MQLCDIYLMWLWLYVLFSVCALIHIVFVSCNFFFALLVYSFDCFVVVSLFTFSVVILPFPSILLFIFSFVCPLYFSVGVCNMAAHSNIIEFSHVFCHWRLQNRRFSITEVLYLIVVFDQAKALIWWRASYFTVKCSTHHHPLLLLPMANNTVYGLQRTKFTQLLCKH